MTALASNLQLSSQDMDLLPTESDIQLYEKLGWHVTPKIIDEETLEKAVAGARAFYAGKRDFHMPSLQGAADDTDGEGKVILNNEFTTLRKKELRDLGFHKLVVATAASLSRSTSIRLFADSLITKRPTKGENMGIVGWHSDKAYWPTCTSDHMLTAWIPLQDVTLEMGPVMHIDGSNNWQHEEELKSFYSFNNQDLKAFAEYLRIKRPEHKKSYMTIKKGQVSFHNCHTIHSSYPNTSKQDRLALAIHFQDHRNKHQIVHREDGSVLEISYDRLCSRTPDGNPNYSDEQLFPVLYQAQSKAKI